MRIPILHEQANEFHHRNLLLQLTLGLVSLGDRLEEILASAAPPAAPSEPRCESSAEEALTDFALGLVALHRSLRARLEAAVPVPVGEPTGPHSEPPDQASIRQLLR